MIMETLQEKKPTLTESYKDFICSFITDEAEKYLTKEKNAALTNSKVYQEKKAELAKLRAEILSSVTNKLYAHKLAVNFGQKWKIAADKLEGMIVDDNGYVLKDGKKVTLSTISECASYMVYLHKTLYKEVTNKLDKIHEIYVDVCGGLQWNDNLEAVCKRVASMRGITTDEVKKAYNAQKAKEEKANKAEEEAKKKR